MELVLKNQKTIDLRLSQKAISPYMQIKRGDLILIKKSGGKVYGQAKVKNVLFFDQLNKKKITQIKRKYQNRLKADSEFWQSKTKAKYGSLIWLSAIKRYLSPVKYSKSDRLAWKIILNIKKKHD